MGQLAERLAVLFEKYGLDPAARQSDLHALAALEEGDAKAALARFHALKREAAQQRRAWLLHELRALGLVADVPSHGTEGMDAKELEREIRQLSRAFAHARDLAASVRAAGEAAARLGERAAGWDEARFARVPFDGLARAAEEADAARRALLREARVAARAHEARARARRLRHRRVEVPDVSSARVPDASEADALLAACEARLALAERVEGAHERATRPLRDPAVARWKGTSRKRLVESARALLASEDAEGAAARLDALAQEAEALRREAAALAEENARARRKGRAPPRGEARAGDTLDGYG